MGDWQRQYHSWWNILQLQPEMKPPAPICCQVGEKTQNHTFWRGHISFCARVCLSGGDDRLLEELVLDLVEGCGGGGSPGKVWGLWRGGQLLEMYTAKLMIPYPGLEFGWTRLWVLFIMGWDSKCIERLTSVDLPLVSLSLFYHVYNGVHLDPVEIISWFKEDLLSGWPAAVRLSNTSSTIL